MDVKTETEDYTKPKIFVATPCYVGGVHVKYLESMLALQQLFIKYGLGFEYFNIPFDSLIPRARNASVTRFLQSKTSTHLLFIDADIQFSPESVIKMLKEDKDVIAGCYPKKAIDFESIKNNYSKTSSQLELIQSSVKYAFNFKPQRSHKMERGVVEVLDAPTGFMMIKKSVIRKMIEAFPETEYKNDVKAYQINEDDRFFDLFQSQVFDGRYLSEDYGFCRLWQKINGLIFADLTVNLNHIGQFSYYGNPMVYLKYSDNIQLSDKKTVSEDKETEKFEYEKPFQVDRSEILNEIIKEKEGFFMDIGSYVGDGYTKHLEDNGWTGICIEGNKKSYEKLKENRKCECVNKVIYNESTEVDFTIFEDKIDDCCGISDKFNANAILKTTKVINDYKIKNEKVKVDTTTVYDICKSINISTIDYLTIDTCGSEFEVLQGICFDKIYVKYLDLKKSIITKKIKNYIKDEFKFYKSQDGYEYYVNKK